METLNSFLYSFGINPETLDLKEDDYAFLHSLIKVIPDPIDEIVKDMGTVKIGVKRSLSSSDLENSRRLRKTEDGSVHPVENCLTLQGEERNQRDRAIKELQRIELKAWLNNSPKKYYFLYYFDERSEIATFYHTYTLEGAILKYLNNDLLLDILDEYEEISYEAFMDFFQGVNNISFIEYESQKPHKMGKNVFPDNFPDQLQEIIPKVKELLGSLPEESEKYYFFFAYDELDKIIKAKSWGKAVLAHPEHEVLIIDAILELTSENLEIDISIILKEYALRNIKERILNVIYFYFITSEKVVKEIKERLNSYGDFYFNVYNNISIS